MNNLHDKVFGLPRITPDAIRLTMGRVAAALLVICGLTGQPAEANHESSKQPPLWTPLDGAERLAAMDTPSGMATVPAGWFLMGSDPKVDRAAGPQEFPQHQIYLNAFDIDTY